MKRFAFLAGIFLLFSFLSGDYITKDRAVRMLLSINAKDFPKSEAVFISNTKTKLNKKCLGYTLIENYRRILTDKARKNNSVSFWYNTHYDSVAVDAIEQIKPDGTIITFDPNKILTEKDDSYSGQMNIYSNLSKVKTGELPDVQIGDIIYTRQKRTIKRAYMKNHYFDFLGIDGSQPYLNKFKELILPRKVKLYVHDLNNKGLEYKFKKEISGKNIIYTFNLSRVPVVVVEPGMEDYYQFAHYLVLTTVKSWEDISRNYYKIVKPHMKVNKAMKAKTRELIQGARNRKEKVSRIFYWIANQVRYLGVDREKYRPGLEPHDVIYTFETKGGVCRDKAALLAAMFRIAGIKADVILISAGYRLPFVAPVYWFNHAITVSYDDQGQPEYIFDPTNENSKDFLPKYLEDNTYLIASKRGDTLRITPVSPPAKNNSSLNIKLKLDKHGNARGSIEFLFSGYADSIFRNYFANLTPYQIKNSVSGIVKILHPSTELVSFESTDYRDKTKDIKISARVVIDNYMRIINNKIFVPFDAANLNIHLLYNTIMSPFNLSDRKYDFKMDGAFSLDTRFEIEFAAGLKSPSIPVIKTVAFEGFKTRMESKSEKNRLIFDYHFETSKLHFKQAQFLPLKAKIMELFRHDNLYIIADSGEKNE